MDKEIQLKHFLWVRHRDAIRLIFRIENPAKRDTLIDALWNRTFNPINTNPNKI